MHPMVPKLSQRKSSSQSSSARSSPAPSATSVSTESHTPASSRASSRAGSPASSIKSVPKRSASTCATEPSVTPKATRIRYNKLTDFSPHTQPLVREGKSLFRLNIATLESFPDNPTSTSTDINVYRGVAKRKGITADLTRVTTDTSFQEDVTKVVSGLFLENPLDVTDRYCRFVRASPACVRMLGSSAWLSSRSIIGLPVCRRPRS